MMLTVLTMLCAHILIGPARLSNRRGPERRAEESWRVSSRRLHAASTYHAREAMDRPAASS